MLGKDYILTGMENILKQVDAEQAEIVYTFKDHQLTRFANNAIHQNVAERDVSLTIKIVNGKKVSSTSLNSIEPEVVKRAIKRLSEMTRFQPDDPDFESLPPPESYTEVATFDQETAECSPEKRAEFVKIITDKAEKFQVNASGQCSTSTTELAIINSLGIRAYNVSTEANLLTMAIEKMEGFSNLLSRKISNIDPFIVAEESVSKCVNSRNPVELKPGTYTIILEPHGVAQLIEFLCLQNFNAKDYLDESSCITGKLGHKITGENISIYNDPFELDGLPAPFDMEGLPKKKVTLIKNGIANDLTHNSYTANIMKTVSNGNQIGPTYKVPYPLNLTMEAGSNSLEKMIASIENGIYITRLNYVNVVDPINTIHTGLTRGGTFMIENGKITKPVYNLRFTESFLKALNEVSMISNYQRLGGEFYAPVLCPALKINSFKFTGSAKSDT